MTPYQQLALYCRNKQETISFNSDEAYQEWVATIRR